MDGKVRVLSQAIANQIAAGEVINRPASVVKELLENAVDAGADNIKIIITDAGRTLIQVIDNGCGMETDDARLAFERHATSKIRQSDDLFSLTTFGFRGEALPSIAAVQQRRHLPRVTRRLKRRSLAYAPWAVAFLSVTCFITYRHVVNSLRQTRLNSVTYLQR